jgi:release factor glutamine methyltransferase
MNENSQPLALANNGWLQDATQQLTAAGIPSPRLDAELILAHTLRKPRTYLHAHPEDFLSEREQAVADARLTLRLDRVPVAYIIGHKEFYGRRFHVTHSTLIPRPESEVLIELLRRALPDLMKLTDGPLRLVDVGTGSGALGITAALEFPDLTVTIVDISKHALTIAEKNAASHHAEVTPLYGDLLSSYPFEPNVVMANLPYVDPAWQRSPETDHEPSLALFATNNGLALIYRLLIQAHSQLAENGIVILEADPRQHDAIVARAEHYGFLCETRQDFGLLLRLVRR